MGIPGFGGDRSVGPTIHTYRATTPPDSIRQSPVYPQQFDDADADIDSDDEMFAEDGDELSDEESIDGDDELVEDA